MNVALDRGHHDPALCLGRAAARLLLGLDEGDEMRHGGLHDPGALHDLREEHLAGPEKVADAIHPGHERPLDHVEGPSSAQAGLLHVLHHELGDSLDQGVGDPLLDRQPPPGLVRAAPVGASARRVRHGEESLRRVGAPVEHQVLHALPERRLDLRVDRERGRVHDPHPHPGRHRVVEEDRVDRFADRVVAAERERDVADATAHQRVREAAPQRARRLHVGGAVAGVLLDPGPDGEDVRVVDDVLVVEPGLLHEDAMGASEDLHLALHAVRLAGLVEGHHHDRGAVAARQAGLGRGTASPPP